MLIDQPWLVMCSMAALQCHYLFLNLSAFRQGVQAVVASNAWSKLVTQSVLLNNIQLDNQLYRRMNEIRFCKSGLLWKGTCRLDFKCRM
jgi:hypothetical protein